MRTRSCCEVAPGRTGSENFPTRKNEGDRRPLAFARRCLDMAGWIVPGAILALLPKCLACIAADIAIGTGVGLSVSTAYYLQMLLVILCVASLFFIAARPVRRLINS